MIILISIWSLNTVAWQVLDNITVKYGLSFLDKLHFHNISYIDNDNMALSLGGFTEGVRVVDMAKGFSTLPENETQKNSNQGKTISSNELQVGDVINYNPSGTYSWNNEYATSDSRGTETLSSSTGESFNVSKWKVLSIDKNANKIEMVPATTPSGEVTLQGTQS